tara:strand:+ start:8997 stop:9689 length:693 start_codon:yes stop_codon:yes gene_type:complete
METMSNSNVESLHQLFKGSVDLETLDYELPCAITKHGYLRITQNCHLNIYVKILNYEVRQLSLDPFVKSEPCRLYLPKDFVFDSASIPWAARSLIPEVGRHTLGASFHDMLYRSAGTLTFKDISLDPNEWQSITLDQRFADNVFGLINQKLKVKSWRQSLLYRGVRLGGHFSYGNYLSQKQPEVGSYVEGAGFSKSNLLGSRKVEGRLANMVMLSDHTLPQVVHSLRSFG